jgi:hypothetical protein
MLQEQLELVPAKESHACARVNNMTGEPKSDPSIERVISAENDVGQCLSSVHQSTPSTGSPLLDAIGPGSYKARPARLRKG